MKKFVLKNPATGKYWNGKVAYNGKLLPDGFGARSMALVYDEDRLFGRLTQDLIDIGALVKEYLPEPPKYRVFIRDANGEKLFYGRLYDSRGFWTEEKYSHHYPKECHIITWDSINDIPIELRGIEAPEDLSAGFLFWEKEG